jgi:hypothetical protein
MKGLLPLTGLVCALLALGCGDSANQPAEVSGTVLCDNEPLKEGEIIFEGDGKTPGSAKIVDGKYTLKVLPGSRKVQIKASRPTAKPDPVMGSAAREQMIAREFNEQTTLTAEVKPGRQDGVDFKVRSIPRPK